MRILFAGTQEIAVPVLEELNRHRLVSLVLTTPDAPGKRGSTLLPSPVKAKALELGLPLIQPEHLGSAARAQVSAFAPDTLVSFCYGKIFGPKFLAMFRHKFNIHPSLLPKYRGCAPLQAAILNQDRKTGISIQDIAAGIDEGDIYLAQSFELDGCETLSVLEEKVMELAPLLLSDLFSNIDVFCPTPQPEFGASYTEFIKKTDGRIDFTKSARDLHAQIRAYSQWPKAECMLDGSPLYLTGVSGSVFDIEECVCDEECGTVAGFEKGKGLKIATGSGYLFVTSLQLPARKNMDSQSFVNGRHDIIGKVLS